MRVVSAEVGVPGVDVDDGVTEVQILIKEGDDVGPACVSHKVGPGLSHCSQPDQ